ncbi:keratin, type I cytoskeletal 19 isoform X2 [Microcaecilia unicolor]|uniref:Keratin, type I cytoskeletal 19-like isoform X2 n=1 Tax=Microcaecilia unicolor TaxID=1415580 RepID=A0A6P7ZVR0_9AMPH|nr:keratin, type I cytoskeletal 19-like isoform X2 [Microcaecilia unicolor]
MSSSRPFWSSSGSVKGGEGRLIHIDSSYSTSSVHGGAGGSRVSVSTARPLASSGLGWGSSGNNFGGGSGAHVLFTNDKETMQNLNARLASYLEKVQSLEKANAELEEKIKKWHEERTPQNKRDYSKYEKIIADLHAQIANGRLNNARLTLQMDNAKLAAQDFKLKYETEQTLRMAIEADVNGLRKLLDDLTIVRTDLEMEVEALRKELILMKMVHEQEMDALQARQRSSTVDVQVAAAPSVDLTKILAEMRQEYEAIIEKNREEAASWYKQKSSTMQQEVTTNTEALESSRKEVNQLKRTLQSLEIEMQSELSKKCSLENTLAETQANYAVKLKNVQTVICQLEEELANVRIDIERQGNEYKILLDIKSRLENEIATYRQLLDGDDVRTDTSEFSKETNRKVKTIVQDVIDGRVVSSKVSEIHQK